MALESPVLRTTPGGAKSIHFDVSGLALDGPGLKIKPPGPTEELASAEMLFLGRILA